MTSGFNRSHPWGGRASREVEAVVQRRRQLRKLIERDRQREEAQQDRLEARREAGRDRPGWDPED